MIEAIALLRRTADDCERRARMPDSNGAVKAEMMDIAAKWHLLAGEAAILCKRSKELNSGDNAACAQRLERCLG
jgi:hypothetical protein